MSQACDEMINYQTGCDYDKQSAFLECINSVFELINMYPASTNLDSTVGTVADGLIKNICPSVWHKTCTQFSSAPSSTTTMMIWVMMMIWMMTDNRPMCTIDNKLVDCWSCSGTR
jgi:hypothetical protein